MPDADSRTTDVNAPGGVMTDEAGVITGALTVRSELSGDRVVLRVQYQDAGEWYAVTNGAVPVTDPGALDAVHATAVAVLHRPE